MGGSAFSTGTVTANITGSVGVLPPGIPSGTSWVLNNIAGTGNGANQDALTVPAGKVFYCYGLVYDAASSSNATLYKNDGTTVVWKQSYTAAPAALFPSICPIPVHAYVAGDIVKVNVTNLLKYNIVGILVTL